MPSKERRETLTIEIFQMGNMRITIIDRIAQVQFQVHSARAFLNAAALHLAETEKPSIATVFPHKVAC